MNNQAPSDHEPFPGKIIPTRRGRLLSGALLLLTFVFFALYQFVAIPFLKTSLSTVPPSNLMAVKGILIVFTSVTMLAGLATILYGRKVFRSGQYPLANAWVWRATIIQRGRAAIKFAWLHIAIGTLVCILGIGLTVYLWRLLDQPMHQFKIIDKVIVIPPRLGIKQ